MYIHVYIYIYIYIYIFAPCYSNYIKGLARGRADPPARGDAEKRPLRPRSTSPPIHPRGLAVNSILRSS